MKKIFTIIAAATLAAAAVMTTSCNKGDEGSYYQIKEDFQDDQDSYFEPVTKIFSDKYYKKQWQSKEEAQKIWAEAEADFKAVENQLHVGDKGFISYSMNKYSTQGPSVEVVETIGTWRFPAAN